MGAPIEFAGVVKALSSAKAPADRLLALIVSLDTLAAESSITTPLRAAHFTAECAHESAGFSAMVENLNYSAAGLLNTFPKYFSKTSAAAYARHPERIANRVYANRMGNGDEVSGDGWRFRGRGIIQLTGHDNYSLYGEKIDVDLLANPDMAADPETSVKLALAYWDTNNLSLLADRDNIRSICQRIQGGIGGLPERVARLRTAKRAFGLATT